MLAAAGMGLWIIIKTLQKMVRMTAMLSLLLQVLAGLEAPPAKQGRHQSCQYKGGACSRDCNQAELGDNHAAGEGT